MGPLAENKTLARRWFDEVINRRRIEAIDEIYAEGYVHHSPGGRDMGREEAKQFAASILEAFPDRVATVLDQIAEGDRVVTRFSSRGTHSGSSRIAGSPGEMRITVGICISRIEGGRIVEDWELADHGAGDFGLEPS